MKEIIKPISAGLKEWRKNAAIAAIIRMAKLPVEKLASLTSILDFASNDDVAAIQLISPPQAGKSAVTETFGKIAAQVSLEQRLPITQCLNTSGSTVLLLQGLNSRDLLTQTRKLYSPAKGPIGSLVRAELMLNANRILKEYKANSVVPGSVLIDESHLANAEDTKNLPLVIEQLGSEWSSVLPLFVSATPFSFLTELDDHGELPALDGPVRTVVQQPSEGYRGIVEFFDNGQINQVPKQHINITKDSPSRRRFLEHLRGSSGSLAIVRLGERQVEAAKQLIEREIPSAQVMLLGERWVGASSEEMSTLTDLEELFANQQITGQRQKLIVFVRNGFSAGIALSEEMKANICAVWETYRGSLASQQQGLIGRVSGYADTTGLEIFIDFEDISEYVEAQRALYKDADLGPLRAYLPTALNCRNSLDSESRQKREQVSIRSMVHNIDYIATVDASALLDNNSEHLAIKLEHQLFEATGDSEVHGLIHYAMNRYQVRTRARNLKYNTFGTQHSVRYIGQNYLRQRSPSLLQLFRDIADDGLSACYYERMVTVGADALGARSKFGILISSPNLPLDQPVSVEDNARIMDLLSDGGPQLNAGGDKPNRLILIIVRRGVREIENEDILIDQPPNNVYGVRAKVS